MYKLLKDYPYQLVGDRLETIPAGTVWKPAMVPCLFVAEGYHFAVIHIRTLNHNPLWFEKIEDQDDKH